VAQREFRQRKQQYVRDLEARVEVLSGDKEERVELMVLLVKNLLKENKELRGMLKGMAGFVGEGECLQRIVVPYVATSEWSAADWQVWDPACLVLACPHRSSTRS
jgi:hypothetical protein